jgi:aminoglycoside phosphotransferase (APT) family kinase protein
VPDLEARRRVFTGEQLRRIAEAVAPGARPLAAEPLVGGIDTATYVLRTTAGAFVVRVYRDQDDGDPATAARNGHAMLTAASAATPLAPRPVFADPDGSVIGEPLVVATYVEGAPLAPGGAWWIEQLADTLAEINAVPLARVRGVPADRTARERVDRIAADPPDEHDPLWEAVVRAMDERADHVRANPPAFLHGDLWFGNTIWRDRRIVGVVDWDGARIGDPARDVAITRADLRLFVDDDAALSFLERYEKVRGPLVELAFWDLVAAAGPIRWLSHWLEGWVELGIGLPLDEARARIERWVTADLAALR